MNCDQVRQNLTTESSPVRGNHVHIPFNASATARVISRWWLWSWWNVSFTGGVVEETIVLREIHRHPGCSSVKPGDRRCHERLSPHSYQGPQQEISLILTVDLRQPIKPQPAEWYCQSLAQYCDSTAPVLSACQRPRISLKWSLQLMCNL